MASEDDARATSRVAFPYLRTVGGSATVVSVIEKAGGAPDKVSLEQCQQSAQAIFDVVTEEFVDADFESFGTRILYGTDVAATIIDAADDVDATAIVFTPRGGSRWAKLLTGDVGHSLISNSNRPMIILPAPEEYQDDG